MAKENWKRLFPGLWKSVMAASFPLETTEEEKEEIARKLFEYLREKRVITQAGRVCDCRGNALRYLEDVIPCLDEEEIELIQSNPCEFYKRFCFSPSRNNCSLYSELDRMEIKGRFRDVSIDDLFEDYRASKLLSPYELADGGVVDSFLENVESKESIFVLAEDFDW